MEGEAQPDPPLPTYVHPQLASVRAPMVANVSLVTGLSGEEVVERLFSPAEPETIRIKPLGGPRSP